MSLMIHTDLNLRNSTKTAGTVKDTIIPTEAACGTLEEPHKKKSTRQVPSPNIDEIIAPGFRSVLEKRPHMNGPRNTEAIAPQEMDSMVTITAGFIQASTMERTMKNPLLSLPSLVRELSEASRFIKP